MSFHRPRKPHKDLNHYLVRDVCERLGWTYGGLPLYLVDVSDIGGEMLDWLVWLGLLCIAVEVKTEQAYRLKDHRMQPGELLFMERCPGPKAIVVTDQEFSDTLALWYPIAKLIDGG